MRTLISGFLHQKSDRQPFFDYVASEAEKMTQEEFEELKGKIFRDNETIKSNRRCHHCPEDQPLLPQSPRGSAYCQQPLHRRLVPLKQQLAAVLCTIHQAPLASATLHLLTVQDEGSRHNLSGILSQLPDLTSTQIVEQPQQQQPQQQLFTITTSAPPQQQQQPPQ